MSVNEPELDEGQLDELREDLGEAFPTFVANFLARCERLPSELAADLERDDLGRVGARAHEVKGTAGYLGAVSLVALLDDLQRAAEAGSGDGVGKNLPALAAAIERLVPRLSARVDGD